MRRMLAIAVTLTFTAPVMAFDLGIGTLVGGALNALPTAVQAAKNGMGMQETHEAVTVDREDILKEFAAEIEKLPPEQREAAWEQAKKSLDKVSAYVGKVNNLVQQQDEARAQIGLKDVAGDLVKGVAGHAAIVPLANSGAVQAVVKGASDGAVAKAIVLDKTGAVGASTQILRNAAETAASLPEKEAAAAATAKPANAVVVASEEAVADATPVATKPDFQ